uniref:Uncharacterized protein n=1 Tax=Anguilla anguilla TaxID=7936 RepID=A0A0E9UK74_ANGAN
MQTHKTTIPSCTLGEGNHRLHVTLWSYQPQSTLVQSRFEPRPWG